MATGWNYIWGESWHEYIQRSTITNDLAGAQRESSREMIGAISGQTASILGGMESVTSVLSDQMGSIAEEISGLNASFQWGFGQMIAQMGRMNDSLQALIEIAKTPVQTWAYNQFEIARENFRKGLYDNCLKRLDKAINGDNTSAGYEEEWRFHQLLGVLRLGFFGCDAELLDSAQAEREFLLAARYAKADHPKEAAKAMLSASWSAYVQGKLPEALKHAEQAFSLDNRMGEAFFQAAKIQMAANAPGQALPVLRKAIDLESAYLVKAAADADFKRHEGDLNAFCEAMRQEQFNVLAQQVTQALNEAGEWAKTTREVAECKDILDRWRGLLSGSWGLLELLTYAKDRFEGDRKAVSEAWQRGHERMRNTFVFETHTAKVEREFDEPYQVEEKGWFSTKMVTKIRRVRRHVEEQTPVLVNLLGEIDPLSLFQFASIPAGKFMMGSPTSETGRYSGETQHEVAISKSFELLTTPVTQALWSAVMGSNPSHFKGPDRPVENVSWNDAQEFIAKLNKMVGTTFYRLPTEAEWEYACRAGTKEARYGELDEIAWNEKNSGGETHPVGQKKPNAWGLYDMIGNVEEWCQDWHGSYPSGSVTDPTGPMSGPSRVNRGGSWNHGAECCRSAGRPDDVSWGFANFRCEFLGFRLARSCS